MKIAFCSSVNVPSRAAEGVDTVKRCQWFSEIGHDVTLLAPNMPDPEADKDLHAFYGIPDNFSVVRVPFPKAPGRRMFAGYVAARRAKQLGVDLVYARALYASYFAARMGCDTVIEMHTPIADAGRTPDRVFRRLIRSPQLKRVVVISDALRRHYRQRYGIPEQMIRVAPEAADDPGEVEPVSLDSERFSVGYVGNLFPGKGMELISELARRCPWADFHCVGGTDQDIARWKDELAGQANVIFHGFVPLAEVPRYCCAFDVLVAPYMRKVLGYDRSSDLSEWMSPLKLFQYMSAGKPIVASDLPVLREVLTDGVTAMLRDPDEPDAWVEALDQLRQDPNARAALAETARQSFLRHYTWKARAETVLEGLGSKARAETVLEGLESKARADTVLEGLESEA